MTMQTLFWLWMVVSLLACFTGFHVTRHRKDRGLSSLFAAMIGAILATLLIKIFHV